MRIGVDNISPGESTSKAGPGGMRSYLQSVVTELASLRPNGQIIVFSPDWAEPLLDHWPKNVERVALRHVPKNRAARIVYQQTALSRAASRHDLDVFFATATIAPLLCRVPIVLAVQFTQFYQWPEAYGKFRTAYLKLMLPWSLRKARRSIIFTESAKRDLVRWTGISPEAISVVPHGLSSDAWRVAEFSPDAPECQIGPMLTSGRPYIVYVSATYGYKNHVRLIQAFATLKKRLDNPHVLLLVGSEVAVSYNELRVVAAQAGVEDEVIIAGRLDPNVRALATYLGAEFAVIPTLYETFGYPVLEAMLCGCPVVTTNYGSMAELAGDAAVLVDSRDVDAIAMGMERMVLEPDLRAQLSTTGRQRAQAFTIARSMKQTLEIVEAAAQGNNAHSVS